MTKIDVYSGFLGAGKTTLIKKLIKEAYAGEKVVLIENEFGEIGVDGGFLKDSGVNITEMNSGCICCSLVGDFAKALKQVEEQYAPDRIIIEPSGVGKLSDVIRAVERANVENSVLNAFCAVLNAFCAVVDANKCKMYMKNFGEFFIDQVKNASCVVLSHTTGMSEEKLHACIEALKAVNPDANYVTAEWDKLDGKTILAAMEKKDSLDAELKKLAEEYEHEHHHHDDDDDDDCCCHDHEHEHEHHHHDDDDDDDCCCHDHEHEHEHHHHDDDDDDDCCCHDHEHEHEHHHHHHADEVFTSWGLETAHKFTGEELKNALQALQNEEKYGTVLRAKGIVDGGEHWWHFDYVPGEPDVRTGAAGATGRLCVIGCKLNEDALIELFKA